MTEHFTRRDVLRILEISERQLAYWERLRLVEPQKVWRSRVYRFRDLISLRTIKQLTEHRIPASRLRRALDALQRQLAEIEAPLTELRIVSDGRRIVVEHEGARLEPLSGQLLLNFETRALGHKLRQIPERTPEEWFTLALNAEADPATRGEAIEAYRHVVELRPDWLEPHINLGTLLYEQGEAEAAAGSYRRALQLDPASPLAHFNLGSVLDELGQTHHARQHLERAVELNPDYADAHYNLALVLEKLGTRARARRHWLRYLTLDPYGPWADYARQHLTTFGRNNTAEKR
ncbi:MAG: tetratricopeptide repeat protein [Acidobacteria bacterium]|nr:tetratricopeptide repeat protein [Acidobacteriota bacterium]